MKLKNITVEDLCVWKKVAEYEKSIRHPINKGIKLCYYNCNGYDGSCSTYYSNRDYYEKIHMRST